MNTTKLRLIPQPSALTFADGEYQMGDDKRIVLNGMPAIDMLDMGQRLKAAIKARTGLTWHISASEAGPLDDIGIVLTVVEESGVPHPQGYALEIRPTGVEIRASDAPGMFYGVCTLIQIIEQGGRALPALDIEDAPSFLNRGVMLDISRDKVPSMATLFRLVDMLASWKVNQLQLYTEHTFSYRNHRVVWQDASPMTEEQVLELDAYCLDRFIELVPNQNSFGHMHRWLKHAPYHELAETHDEFETPWGFSRKGPFGLDATNPRSLDLVRELYDELLPNFSSRQFNVGCDETIDLGQGKSKALVEKQGKGKVYLDFVKKLSREVKARGHVMQFWGDIIVHYPELVKQLPKDAIALEWGYEWDDPFDAHGKLFADSGIAYYVCPGTSSWQSLLGRTSNMKGNIANACENGLKHGAIGVLNTDWGDNGHWQQLPFSYAGFAYGAAMSWDPAANKDVDLAAALDVFVFKDSAGIMGKTMLELGNVYTLFEGRYHNGTPFNYALQRSLDQIREFGKGAEGARKALAEIDALIKRMAKHKMTCDDAELVEREVKAAARLAKHGCERILLAFETSPTRQKALRRRLGADLTENLRDYKRLWHARNRPGGFEDSAARLRSLRKDYR